MRIKTERPTRFVMSDKMFRSLVFGGRYNVLPVLLSMFSTNSNRKENQNNTINYSNDNSTFGQWYKKDSIHKQHESHNPDDMVICPSATYCNGIYCIFKKPSNFLQGAFLPFHIITSRLNFRRIISKDRKHKQTRLSKTKTTKSK